MQLLTTTERLRGSLWIQTLMGLWAPGDVQGEGNPRKCLYHYRASSHGFAKANHEHIGKNRCHCPSTRLEKGMRNCFMKHGKHMDRITKLGYDDFLKKITIAFKNQGAV